MTAKVYKSTSAQGPWDAIIIGSGIGGLSSAALLAKAGRRVLVLERHYVAGGFTHTFERKGYRWDVGIHYIGEVHRKNSVLRKVCDTISDGQLLWARMPEVYDRAVFGEDTYDFVAGRENLKARLKDYFPSEGRAIDDYFRIVDEAAGTARGYFTEKVLPPFLAGVAGPIFQRKFLKYSDRTTWDVLSGITRNAKLLGVLTTQYGDYGLPPKKSSFAVHAMVARHYFEGGNYPVGGSERIAETIIPVIEKAGGCVLVKAEVERILIDRNRAGGVRLAGGDEIRAPIVISDCGVPNTFGKLISPEIAGRLGFLKKLKKVQPSCPHVCLYIGIKESAETLHLPKSNYWIYPGYDHDENLERFIRNEDAPLPVTYISFPSAKDPAWESSHPGRSTIEAVGFVPFEWFQKWSETGWMKRGDDYGSLKQRFTERLLEQVTRFVPQVKGRIDYHELSTPLSTKHFANYDHGEIYGIDHTPERFRLRWLRPRTPVKGLFLTGQDIVTVGFGGALMGGVLTASAILKQNMISEIFKRQPPNGS